MLGKFFTIFDANKKEIENLERVVDQINNLSSENQKLKDADFAQKTEEFKKRLEKGEKPGDILPEAFALVREASWHAIGLRPYGTQLIAGIVLSQGKIVEQKTGEGKTLSAVAPLYLHALTEKGVHLVTVNDYLARRDAGWNGPTFKLLGLSVGAIIQEGKSYVYDPEYNDPTHGDERLAHLRPVQRKEAYDADITYGTNNEFGFDYLRDNMATRISHVVQRSHYFAIVDEVDSVLVDEARTPLIISAPDTEPTDKYYKFAQLVDRLSPDTDYTIDEKLKTATLTEHGVTKVEKILGVDNLYEKDFDIIHHIENSLRSRTLYLKDRDYVVKDNQVIIVDEFTGRLMFGRRWSDGLHQAIEAKENVSIQQETKTLATISFQNYFRMYERLGGMTGTAATEAEEFHKIYNLDVVVVPTYRPTIRKDYPDLIYKTMQAKYSKIVTEINQMQKLGRPVLVGTTSIEKNEIIANYLKKKRIQHNVLNAKNHEKEALIIAEAGKPGAITVATNMAGRGVDIILGGARPDMPPGMNREQYGKTKEFSNWKKRHDEVVQAGGLHVVGTERHESRRIDNQLRGRSGRLGDPGSSHFYLSLEDDLMRIFGGERIASLMTTLQIPEDQPIENKLISRAIEQAQVKVETFHFDARKRVVEYDDVANQQREIIYKLRKQILEAETIKDKVEEKLQEQVKTTVNLAYANQEPDKEQLLQLFLEIVPFNDQSHKALLQQLTNQEEKDKAETFLINLAKKAYETRQKQVGDQTMREIEKISYLSSIDSLWIEHLTNLDDLREGVGLRGYGQKDPLVEYKNEAFELFDRLMVGVDTNMTRRLFRVLPAVVPQSMVNLDQAQTNEDKKDNIGLVQQQPVGNHVQSGGTKKLGRNDPCWCGKKDANGKPIKWKRCHYPQLSQN